MSQDQERIADDELAQLCRCDGTVTQVVALDLRDARRQRDTAIRERDEAVGKLQDAPVQCDCHPGVRWTIETWGQECPLSKAERERDEARRAVKLLRELAETADAYLDDPSSFWGCGDSKKWMERYREVLDATASVPVPEKLEIKT